MMLFQVTYTMLPGQRDAFLQMMRESGILDQIRREEGCLDYRYYLPEEEDGTLLLVERWTGPEAQKAHMATSHMARLGQVKAQYVAETSVVTWALDCARTGRIGSKVKNLFRSSAPDGVELPQHRERNDTEEERT